MVERQPSKLTVGVRFSLPAPLRKIKEKEITIMCRFNSMLQFSLISSQLCTQSVSLFVVSF